MRSLDKIALIWILFGMCFGYSQGGAQPPGGQSSVPGISVTHNQFYCPEAPVPIVETVEISSDDSSNSTLDEVFIQISEGYQQGLDLLTYSGFIPSISSSWSVSEGVLTLSGTASFDDYERAIENVLFQSLQSVYEFNRSISINLGTANYLPSTGHYYQYVSAPGISWSDARAEAEQQSYFGLQGYLVTLTSEEEAQLAGEQSPGTGWIGGSDAAAEGVWRWVTGPESGDIFWEGAVNGQPPTGAFAFWNCGEPNDFQGNEDYAHITDNSVAGCGNTVDPDFIGSWNDLPVDSGATDPNNPYYPKGYIIEFGGFPDEPDINLSASSVINMPQVLVETVGFCGPGTYELSVTGNATDYYWYDSPDQQNLVHIGESLTVTLTSPETYWISPRFFGCPVGGVQPLNAIIYDNPDAFNQSVIQCDSEGDTDGITEFNLSVYDLDVVGGDLTDRQVTHYEDAQLTQQISSTSYTNLFNGQIVYARVENTNTNCTSSASIQLNVSVPNINAAYLEACDDIPEDGFTEFDLSEADDQVIENPGSGITTAYYETYQDALLQNNPLPRFYRNTVPDYQVIYVRLEEGNNCFGINDVELVVRPLPQLKPDETVYYCLNTFPEPITLEGGIINDVPNNYYYNWSTGETTIEIQVNEPGTYTVEVTEVNGCTNSRVISVLPSETASIDEIIVEPTGDLNTVVIEVSGTGSYEYALDDILGPYQTNNTFLNVFPGVRTVYVRDVLGDCGIVSEEVSVIGYPRFFTPNGDGTNDLWGIAGFGSTFPFNGEVHIFNRQGKLLATLNASNQFWDGRYNGNIMPASDYWFTAQLNDGKQLTGHFSLRR